MVDRGGRDYSKNVYEWPMGLDNSVGIDCGSEGGGMAGKGKWGKNWDNYNKNNNKNSSKHFTEGALIKLHIRKKNSYFLVSAKTT